MKKTELTQVEFKYIPPSEVRNFITDQFSDLEIKRSINTPGKIMFNMVAALEQGPLFYYHGNKESRLAFSSWYGALDLRTSTYTNSLARDLYLLHELNHKATLIYKPMNDKEWMIEHIRNEKASSFWSEALVYFEYPSLFEEASKQFALWVAPYFNDEQSLIKGILNHELYAQSPELCAALLFQEFVNISVKDYNSLSAAELRSRKYDYLTEAWCDANSVLQKYVNQHFIEYRQYIADNRLQDAVDLHTKWLMANVSKRGVLFDHDHFLRTNCNSQEIFRLAKSDKRYATLLLKYNIPHTLSLQGFLNNIVNIMNQEESQGKVTMTALVAPTKELIKNAGITNTVYSLFTQPARQIHNELYNDKSIQDNLYGLAESRRQDGLNSIFTDQYKAWTNGLVVGLDDFSFAYPTSGSTEALRESIIEIESNARKAGHNIRIHTFQGEYEGVRGYASSVNIPIVEHSSRNLEHVSASNELRANDIFYLSHPSSIDGNVWPDLDRFLDLMYKNRLRVIIDLAYVGTYVDKNKINVNHPAVECVYFSLSKSFGLYYSRVGGVYSRSPINLLVGNKWFKNTFSMTLGTTIMQRFDRNVVPKFYKHIQKALVWHVNSKYNLKLQASDIFLTAQQRISQAEYLSLPNDLKILCRPHDNGYVLRACLQPLLDYLTNEFSRTFPLFNFQLKSNQILNNKLKSCSTNTPCIQDVSSKSLEQKGWYTNGLLKKSFPLLNQQISRFLEEVCVIAKKYNHHPTIEISDGKCIISLVTHATNTVTKVDAQVANVIDDLYAKYDHNDFKLLTFSSLKPKTSISKIFAFKDFELAFDFAKNIRALATKSELLNSQIQIDWGACTITSSPEYLEKVDKIYNALGTQAPTQKHRAKL